MAEPKQKSLSLSKKYEHLLSIELKNKNIDGREINADHFVSMLLEELGYTKVVQLFNQIKLLNPRWQNKWLNLNKNH